MGRRRRRRRRLLRRRRRRLRRLGGGSPCYVGRPPGGPLKRWWELCHGGGGWHRVDLWGRFYLMMKWTPLPGEVMTTSSGAGGGWAAPERRWRWRACHPVRAARRGGARGAVCHHRRTAWLVFPPAPRQHDAPWKITFWSFLFTVQLSSRFLPLPSFCR